jgi:peptidoglycan/xylan/chitin deacetylase (PgdA/CDA1 family)
MSVYEIAYPILEKYGMKATVFIIGSMHGETFYRGTDLPIYPPHFGDMEAIEMIRSGVISIQSHSYDMHQTEPDDAGSYRRGAMQRLGESQEDYIKAFNEDFERAAVQIEDITGARPSVYSYPFGRSGNLSEKLLKSNGIKATLTIVRGYNVVTRNVPESLFRLKRYNVPGDITADRLLSWVNVNPGQYS